MTITRFGAALLAAVLLFAACGDDDDGGENAAYVDAIVAQITEDDTPFSESQNRCLAEGYLDAVGGASALEAAGVSPEDLAETDSPADIEDFELPDDAVEKIAGVFGTCDIDLVGLMLEEIGDELPEEAKACLADELDNDSLGTFFAGTLTGDDPGDDDAPPGLFEALAECGAF